MSLLPTVKLAPQRPERLNHPWVYDNEIQSGPDRRFENGGLVRVVDARGRAVGVGYLNSRSKIAIRYLSRDPSTVIDAAFWRDRIANAAAYRRARYAGQGGVPSAYRLVHGEADGLPGLVVDVYAGTAVVQFLALGLEPWRAVLVDAIVDTAHARSVYERSDSPVRRLEGLEEQTGLLSGDAPPDVIEYEDDGVVVLVDVIRGGKTGLFLDQRENQRTAAAEAAGRDVLNCFAYTGLFGLRAARSGAVRVRDVESSEPFNAMNQAQWDHNGLGIEHSIAAENVFDYLRAHEKDGDRHDMIVLDPPAFTKNRASREGAARGYNEINRMALRMLRPGGILVTCSCSHHLTAAEFREIVEGAVGDAHRTARLIAQRGQPPDHPVLLDAPESEYLKCLILAVE
ncbi:MAG: class I SAM-dependent rRNA methyltransferase [Capsulimonadaceae bacterium]